jgi:hypothetical protein
MIIVAARHVDSVASEGRPREYRQYNRSHDKNRKDK